MQANSVLEEAMGRQYRFDVIADPDGSYVIRFPDLPGCMTQIDDINEVGEVAREISEFWIETTFDLGEDIPLPIYPEEFSGKFNVRIPRSLHRDLVHLAADEGVRLNQLMVSLLSDRLVWQNRISRCDDANQSSPRTLAKVSQRPGGPHRRCSRH